MASRKMSERRLNAIVLLSAIALVFGLIVMIVAIFVKVTGVLAILGSVSLFGGLLFFYLYWQQWVDMMRAKRQR